MTDEELKSYEDKLLELKVSRGKLIRQRKKLLEDDNVKKYIRIEKEYRKSIKKEITLENNIPYMIPRLINEIPDKILNRFIKYYKRVDLSIREKISEIKYDPNDFDEDRFLLYMDDGNSVYITITKFERLNYYNEVLPQLDGRKGYLYLDSGNHFQIMQ